MYLDMIGKQAVTAILEDNNGVLVAGHHRSLRSTVWRLTKARDLVAAFPGVYVARVHATNPRVWLAALSAWRPEAVITGRVALAVAEDRLPSTVTELGEVVLHSLRAVRNHGRVRFRQRVIDPESVTVRAGIRIHSPVAAAVDVAATDDGRAIDTLLREHRLDPRVLMPALSLHRRTPGNTARTGVVAASLVKPYSFAERLLHKILTEAKITGWVANHALRLDGVTVRPDVLFRDIRLVIEFDSLQYHGPDRFEFDRRRNNRFAKNGYTVLQITWDMLQDPGYVIATVTDTIKSLAWAA